MNRKDQQIQALDGFILNIFKTEKPIVDESQFNDEDVWICFFLDQSTDLAYKYIKHMLSKCKERIDRLQVLYICRSCVKGFLDEIVEPILNTNYNIPVGVSFDQTEYEKRLRARYKEELASYTKTKLRYEQALKRINQAIYFYEDCNNIDCSEQKKGGLCQLSNSQKVLLYYYGLKSIGYEFRKNADIAPAARLMHLLFGEEFKTTQSSDFYKKLRKAPNFKKDKSLISDLELIKPLFAKVGMKGAVQLINLEIETASQERKALAK